MLFWDVGVSTHIAGVSDFSHLKDSTPRGWQQHCHKSSRTVLGASTDLQVANTSQGSCPTCIWHFNSPFYFPFLIPIYWQTGLWLLLLEKVHYWSLNSKEMPMQSLAVSVCWNFISTEKSYCRNYTRKTNIVWRSQKNPIKDNKKVIPIALALFNQKRVQSANRTIHNNFRLSHYV